MSQVDVESTSTISRSNTFSMRDTFDDSRLLQRGLHVSKDISLCKSLPPYLAPWLTVIKFLDSKTSAKLATLPTAPYQRIFIYPQISSAIVLQNQSICPRKNVTDCSPDICFGISSTQPQSLQPQHTTHLISHLPRIANHTTTIRAFSVSSTIDTIPRAGLIDVLGSKSGE